MAVLVPVTGTLGLTLRLMLPFTACEKTNGPDLTHRAVRSRPLSKVFWLPVFLNLDAKYYASKLESVIDL